MNCLHELQNFSTTARRYNLSRGKPFCGCTRQKGQDVRCDCGEDEVEFDWEWDPKERSPSAALSNDNRDVHFHTEYSSGTAAVRGNRQFVRGWHHYWEIKMLTPVYGTDMMVGVCTADCNLHGYIYRFCSILGMDSDSWGFSYTGKIQHLGQWREYAPQFGIGTIVGVHLDMWQGTLEFYLNRKRVGIAFRDLQDKSIYPAVSSTAARSGMRIICSRSCPDSLQMRCLKQLSKSVPSNSSLFDAIDFPPGLKAFVENNYWWLVNSKTSPLAATMAMVTSAPESCPRVRLRKTDAKSQKRTTGVCRIVDLTRPCVCRRCAAKKRKK